MRKLVKAELQRTLRFTQSQHYLCCSVLRLYETTNYYLQNFNPPINNLFESSQLHVKPGNSFSYLKTQMSLVISGMSNHVFDGKNHKNLQLLW